MSSSLPCKSQDFNVYPDHVVILKFGGFKQILVNNEILYRRKASIIAVFRKFSMMNSSTTRASLTLKVFKDENLQPSTDEMNVQSLSEIPVRE